MKKWIKLKINSKLCQICQVLFQKFLFFEEESKSNIFSHPDKPPLNINIIRRRYIKRNHFVLDVECIKLDYFSPYNNAKRNYFQQFPPQVRNALRKQYEKYMQ